jgi:N-acetylglucosamine-6-phosphate deacetylase
MVARAPDGSHLVGSAMAMPHVLKNLTGPVGLTQRQAVRLLSQNPKRALGMK